MIRLARPWIGEEELAGVTAVLESGMLVMGAEVAAFEAQLALLCSRDHAVACGSGTTALELALEALSVTEGEVLCPDLSWPSPAHAIARAGATPVLVDVDPRTWNATAEALAAARTPRTRAAIVIDQFGMPAPHPSIADALAGLPIVVDAACSLGSTIDGRPAASFGAIACLSFHPRKVVTTGEGGACVTDDAALAAELRVLRNHGQRAAGIFTRPAGNQRLTEMAAAMGRAQLGRLEAILARRRALAARYHDALSELEVPLRMQEAPAGAVGNAQTFGVLLPDGMAREVVVAHLREDGVEAGRLSYAMHLLPSLGPRSRGGPFPVAERIDAQGLALPLHPLLTDDEQTRVIASFTRAVSR